MARPPGAPPLRPFGLVLHHDGRWSHEGVPFLNHRLRAAFDRSVDAHVRTIRKKLGDHRGCIETVRSIGYRFAEEDPE